MGLYGVPTFEDHVREVREWLAGAGVTAVGDPPDVRGENSTPIAFGFAADDDHDPVVRVTAGVRAAEAAGVGLAPGAVRCVTAGGRGWVLEVADHDALARFGRLARFANATAPTPDA